MESAARKLAGVSDETTVPRARHSLFLTGVLLALGASGLYFAFFPSAYLTPWVALPVIIGAVLAGWLWGGGSILLQHNSTDDLTPARVRVLLGFLFLVALGMRLSSIDFGLPVFLHPDEPTKAEVIQRMAKRDSLNPRYFRHPSLLLYVTKAIHFARNGDLAGPTSAQDIILSGRYASAVFGALTILPLYLFGAHLLSHRGALLASALFAFSPLAFVCSRYVKEDALCTFFLVASLAALARAFQSARIRDWFLAAFLAGLAMGSKYSGFLAILSVAAFPWLAASFRSPDRKFLRALPLAAGCAVIGFLLTTPFLLVSFAKFLGGARSEFRHLLRGHNGLVIEGWSQLWTFSFARGIAPGMTLPVALAALIGIGMLLRSHKRWGGAILALVLLIYLPAELGRSKPFPQPDRYVLPALPFLCVCAAAFAESLRRHVPTVAATFALLLLAFPYLRTASLVRDMKSDTRIEAGRWLAENVPSDSRILLVGGVSYAPQLQNTTFSSDRVSALGAFKEYPVDTLLKSDFDYVLATSFSMDRFYVLPHRVYRERERFEEYLRRLELVGTLQTASGPYGFHNPTVYVFRVPHHPP